MTKPTLVRRSIRGTSDWRKNGVLVSLLCLGSHIDVACCFVETSIGGIIGSSARARSSTSQTSSQNPLNSLLRVSCTGTRRRYTSTILGVDMLGGDNNPLPSNKDPSALDGREPNIEDRIVVTIPALLSLLAFTFYEDTSKTFHSFVEFASQNTWEAVDGGAYLSDLIGPALNGPVTTFISLLFGSLTSMTMASLYNRQANLALTFSSLVEDVRLADIHFEFFPPEYRERATGLLQVCAAEMMYVIEEELTMSEMDARRATRQTSTEQLMVVLHEMSIDPRVEVNNRILNEAYDTVNRIIASRCSMAGLYNQRFPLWHYGNLGLLGTAICVIFFIMTDRSALIFLGAFQLKLCWAMLVGTIAVMSVVIYDLNTPLTGVFQIVKETDRQFLKRFTAGASPRLQSQC